MQPKIKDFMRLLAQQTLGCLPPSRSRLVGKPASEGGKPVRRVGLRPWASYPLGSFFDRTFGAGRVLRRVLRGGVEGLPQPLAKEFAQEWAAYCRCRYGLLLPHGTDALRLGLAAALDHDGLSYGGEVIVPNFSFIATATAALDRRFGLAFVDIDPDTLLIDPQKVEEAIMPGRTRAIMPVHLFGQPANMSALQAIAAKYDLKVIEDAAQAHGAEWETGPVGSLGDAAGFSFQSHKNLACGEGGILTTNDEALFERAYAMHNAGRSPVGEERWEHYLLGWNCRPTEYQAALLSHRFKSFEREQSIRRKNFARLRELLEGIHCVQPLAVHGGVRRHGMHMFVMRYRRRYCANLPFDEFLARLRAEGIPIYRAYETTMSKQPALRKLMERHPKYFRLLPTPVADQATTDTAYIAHNVFLGTATDMEDIAAGIRKVENYYATRAVRFAANGAGKLNLGRQRAAR